MLRKRITFSITIEVDSDVSISHAKDYLHDAIGTYCKGLQPPERDEGGENPDARGDPLWTLRLIRIERL